MWNFEVDGNGTITVYKHGQPVWSGRGQTVDITNNGVAVDGKVVAR